MKAENADDDAKKALRDDDSKSAGDDAMANEKLAEGIRKFAADLDKLESIVKAKI